MSPGPSGGRFVIAVDGPGGVGKTTVCRSVADALGVAHLNTGAFYRAATVVAMLHRVDLSDEAAVMRAVASVDLDYQDGRMLAEGVDMSGAIRSEQVTARASRLAALAGVRTLLVGRQRRWVKSRGGRAVVEGRDIGTVVFPAAAVKVFLTARPEVRAERRAGQVFAGVEIVREGLARRDHLDSTRLVSPLVPAPDSLEIDTSDIGVPEVVDRVLRLSAEHGIRPI